MPLRSPRERAFRALSGIVVRYPWPVLAAAFALSVLSIIYTKARLEFQTGQEDLISANGRDSRNYFNYEKQFPDLDGLIVIVRAEPDPARAERFATELGQRLAADQANVKSIFYRIDPEIFADHALLYMGRDDLEELASRLRDHQGLLGRYAANPSLANLFGLINEEAGREMVSQMAAGLLDGGTAKPAAAPGKFDLGFLDAVLSGMVGSEAGTYQSPWEYLTRVGGASGVVRDGFVASDNGKYLLIHIAPGDGAKDGPDPVDAIQHTLDELRAQYPDVEAGMTGGPALAHAEAASTAHDIALASGLAIGGNLLLITIPFGGLVEPLFAVGALLMGVAWSFGFTTLFVGHLNLLSAVFTSVLAGIGINFPIHLMARYDEARREGRGLEGAMELAMVNTGTGVVASATIMALAFITPIFSDFKGIAELGLVSAAGLFMCLLSAMLVFPALVTLRDRNRRRIAIVAAAAAPRPLMEALFNKPGLLVGICVGVTALGLLVAPRVRFDQNLLKLQAQDTEAVRFEEKLLKDSGRSSWFAVALAASDAEAERKAAALRKLPEVADAETLASYVPQEQVEKRAILRPVAAMIGPIRTDAPRSDSARLLAQMKDFGFKLAGGGDSAEIAETRRLLDQAIAALQAKPDAFNAFESRMAADFAVQLRQFRAQLQPGNVTQASLPEVLRSRFVGISGAHLVQIYPRGDIWDDAPLKRFVDAVRSVDPDVTGPPIQTYSIASVMRRGYERAALLALIGVFVFVFADFRRLRDTALATVPLIFGGAWLLALMGLMRWDFNLANLFAVPIIIGTGVDNGVNMLYRWREEVDKSQLILNRAVGKSVTICSLTTIAGFAALIPASHHGISSLGWVLSSGVSMILVATLIVLPALLKQVGSRIKRADEPMAPPAPRMRAGASAIVMLGVLLLATPCARAQGQSSAALTTEAESMIEAAGHKDPMDLKQIHEAVTQLKQAIAANPRNDSAYVDLGFAYGLLKDPNDAVDAYRQATLINPSAANFKELADIYMRVGRPTDALMAANAGIQKEPANAGLYNARGMALNDLLRFDEAERDFRKALELDPSLTAAADNLKTIGAKASAHHSTLAKPSAEPQE